MTQAATTNVELIQPSANNQALTELLVERKVLTATMSTTFRTLLTVKQSIGCVRGL